MTSKKLGLSSHSPVDWFLRRVLQATRRRADRHAARRRAQLGVTGQVPGEDDSVDVCRGHGGLLRGEGVLEARRLAESRGGSGRYRGGVADCGSFLTGSLRRRRKVGASRVEAAQARPTGCRGEGPAASGRGRALRAARLRPRRARARRARRGAAATELRSGGGGVPGRSLMIRWRRMPSVIFRLWSSCSSSGAARGTGSGGTPRRCACAPRRPSGGRPTRAGRRSRRWPRSRARRSRGSGRAASSSMLVSSRSVRS